MKNMKFQVHCVTVAVLGAVLASCVEQGPARYKTADNTIEFFRNFSTMKQEMDDESHSVLEGIVDWDQLPEEHKHLSKFHLKKSAIPVEDCRKIIDLLTEVEFETDADSVDDATTFEFWLVNQNRVLHDSADGVRKRVMDILQPSISGRIQAVVDAARPGEKLRPCFSFIRRYTQREEEERMKHLTHFDIQSYATFVVSLNTQGEDFHGGIYVATAISSSNKRRHYLDLSAGDGAFHQSDLLHGVNVVNGTRWSFILWFSGPGGDCNSDPRTWHKDLAEEGDPVYQFLHAHRTHDRMVDEKSTRPDLDEQMLRWLGRSARNGFTLAQTQYGDALFGLVKNEDDVEKEKEAVEMLSKASEHGEGEAMATLGSYYLWKSEYLAEGSKERTLMELKAAALFDESCAAQTLDGCIALADAILEERAGERDGDPLEEAIDLLVRVASPKSLWKAFEISENIQFLHRAAKVGHTEAQFTYGTMLVEDEEKDTDQGMKYLEAAAAKDSFSAKSYLKRLKRRAAEMESESDGDM